MMKKFTLALFLGLAVFLLGLPAQADVIYDNGGSELSGGLYSDSAIPIFVANEFSLDPGANTITDVHWWGFYYIGSTAGPDDFSILIYADTGSGPEATPSVLDVNVGSVTATDTGMLDSSGHTVYAYSVDISPVNLTANTTYWLSIVNATTSQDSSFWVWSLSDSSPGDHVQVDLGDGFGELPYGQMAFTLTNDGVVPEPASIMLMGLGLGGIALRARRKRS